MPQEIERKFLVQADYKPYIYSSTHIVQGYICRERGRTVRVRIQQEQAFLTIKGPSTDNGLSRYEWEQPIPLADAVELMKLCVGGVIDKHRHLVKVGSWMYEVDEFHGANEGLTVAEIELPSVDAEFERPAWLGREVTGDKKYYNTQLLQYPYQDWEK